MSSISLAKVFSYNINLLQIPLINILWVLKPQKLRIPFFLTNELWQTKQWPNIRTSINLQVAQLSTKNYSAIDTWTLKIHFLAIHCKDTHNLPLLCCIQYYLIILKYKKTYLKCLKIVNKCSQMLQSVRTCVNQQKRYEPSLEFHLWTKRKIRNPESITIYEKCFLSISNSIWTCLANFSHLFVPQSHFCCVFFVSLARRIFSWSI